MLDRILKPPADGAVGVAPALVAGEWVEDGPRAERTGPYVRRVVSAARTATPEDIATGLREVTR